MIFHRALLRELANTMLAVFIVLLTITITTLVIRFLGQAASGALASEAVIAFLGFSMMNYLPVLLSLTLFIAVLLTLSRSYRDSEMAVWFCSGLSISAWIRPVLYFSAPVILTIAVLSLFLSPWALQKRAEFKRQIDSRDELAAVSPGVFKESRHSDRIYFVESFAGSESAVRNIFMQSSQHQKLGVVVAQKGYQTQSENGDRFLVLLNGRRYEGIAGIPDFKILEFERYAVRIEPYEAKLGAPTTSALSTASILAKKTALHQAEFQWRVSLPLSALILALLAIPLSFVSPRAGPSFNLMLALLIFMIYGNFLSITQAWVAQDKLTPVIGLWGVHAIMLLLLAFFFFRQLSFIRIFRRKA